MADASDLQSKFSDVRTLGEGGFGRVYRGCDKSTGQTYALKVLPLSSRGIASAVAEIEALCRLPVHQHIIGYHQCMILNGGRICLVMEYCDGGNLNDFLLKHGPEPARDLRFMREIASAVAFLHSQGVIHRDLKPDNILLTASGSVKVADFGLAKIASDFQQGGNLYKYYMESYCGTKLFFAPEIFDRRYTESADVFAMGAVFVCILERKTIQVGSGREWVVPYFTGSPTNPVGVGKALHIGQLSQFKLGGDLNISPTLRALVETMLAKSHTSRPTASQVVQRLAIG